MEVLNDETENEDVRALDGRERVGLSRGRYRSRPTPRNPKTPICDTSASTPLNTTVETACRSMAPPPS
jgi:hypothetical protein